jgi:hypothetical protein
MKIIRAGAIANPGWWIGKQVTCEQCCCIFELEKAMKLGNTAILAEHKYTFRVQSVNGITGCILIKQ